MYHKLLLILCNNPKPNEKIPLAFLLREPDDANFRVDLQKNAFPTAPYNVVLLCVCLALWLSRRPRSASSTTSAACSMTWPTSWTPCWSNHRNQSACLHGNAASGVTQMAQRATCLSISLCLSFFFSSFFSLCHAQPLLALHVVRPSVASLKTRPLLFFLSSSVSRNDGNEDGVAPQAWRMKDGLRERC